MKNLFLILLISFLGINQISIAQTNDKKSKEILNKVAKKAKTFKNLKFQFDYRMQDKAHNLNNNIPGTIVLKGNMYNLHIMGSNVITDGKTVWTNDPEAEEITIRNIDKSDDTFAFLKIITSVDDNYTSKYIKSTKVGGKSFYIIDLVPKKGQSYYKIRVKVDKVQSWITEAIIYEKSNITYTFSIKKFETNLNLPAGYFKLDPSKFPDLEIVDLR